METTCPHCSQGIEIDPETLNALQGTSRFECPTCAGSVPVPPMPERSPAAPPPGQRPVARQQAPNPPQGSAKTHAAALRAHRGLNRNLLILGTITLLTLGGLGVFIASRNGGNIFNTKQNITNQIINNSYFSQLIATGVTTEKDLATVTDIRPDGDGFIGVSEQALPWRQAEELAKRTGARILNIGETPRVPKQELVKSLNKSFAPHLSALLWVTEDGQPRVLDGPNLLSVTTLDRPRKVLLRWGKQAALGESFVERPIVGPWRTIWFRSSVDPMSNLDDWRLLARSPSAVEAVVPSIDFTFAWSKGPSELNLSPELTAAKLGNDRFGLIASTRALLSSGNWKFTVRGDDGYRLFVNGKMVLERWQGAYGETSADFHQPQDSEIDIVLEYFEEAAIGEVSFDVRTSQSPKAVPAAPPPAGVQVLRSPEVTNALAVINRLGGKYGVDAGAAEEPKPIIRAILAGTSQITDDDLLKLKPLTGLRVLDLNSCHRMITDKGLAVVTGMSDLEELDLGHCYRLTELGMESIRGLSKLKVLKLQESSIVETGNGLAYLKGLKSLRVLWLTYSTLLEDQYLANLTDSPSIEDLDLKRCEKLTDAALDHVTQLLALRKLDLAGTQVTDIGIRKLHNLKGLKEITLGGPDAILQTKVSDRGVAELQTAIPGLKITR